ncbi:MAG TPA: hypothetical protein VKC61_21335 [Pyrinomonadaceae bacterium]|nr:hypothetical protein [Pyrinomonadaceae bacterium]
MKRLLITLALTCVLSGSVLAGDVDTAGAPAPVPGDLSTSGAPSPSDAPGDMGNGLAQMILDLLF